MVKFAKNDRLDALIVVARDEQFLFFPWKLSKGGTIGWFFSILGLDSEKANFQKTKVKSSPSLSWAWPSSAPACSLFIYFFAFIESFKNFTGHVEFWNLCYLDLECSVQKNQEAKIYQSAQNPCNSVLSRPCQRDLDLYQACTSSLQALTDMRIVAGMAGLLAEPLCLKVRNQIIVDSVRW